MADLDQEIENAKQECQSTVTIRSDGKPYTPNGGTLKLVQLLMRRAGQRGMTRQEIADELPQRKSPPSKLLKRWEDEGKVERRGGRYILSEFAFTW